MTDAKDVRKTLRKRARDARVMLMDAHPTISYEDAAVVALLNVATEQIEALTRERDEARDAIDTVIRRLLARTSLAPIYCERLHHTKKDYHKSGEPCPVEARIKTLIQIIEEDA